jgi:hypothetical protein
MIFSSAPIAANRAVSCCLSFKIEACLPNLNICEQVIYNAPI